MFILFLKGLIIGFAVALPIGPVGILCIQKSLHHGKGAGFVTGLGAATADATFACIAGFSLTLIADMLLNHVFMIRLIGSFFLFYIAIKIIRERSAHLSLKKNHNSLAGYSSSFFLTITNPMTIVGFMAIFAAFGLLHTEMTYLRGTALISGVFIGSMIWWAILSTSAAFFRSKLKNNFLCWLNLTTGTLIGILGIIILISLL